MRILRRMSWKFMSSYGKYHCFKGAIYMLLPDNILQIGHQRHSFNWVKAMSLG